MHPVLPFARRLIAATAFLLPLAAHAQPATLYVPFEGAGNVSVFDITAGTGGWTGSIDQSSFPAVPTPLQLVSVVLFQFDTGAQTLSGTFEFTTTNLLSTVFGTLSGSYVKPDILGTGGQFSIDYNILGGTGAFSGATGYGLSFVDFDPTGPFNNYAEGGALVLTVPEPATPVLALAGLALLAALAAGRRRAPAPRTPG
jgi:MYXO-CTERM domain-containing protein